MSLPTGTLTFLLTDVEGSTKLWELNPEAMAAALARHDALIEACVAAANGVLVRPRGEGDSRFAVFAHAPSAVAAAFDLQCALHNEPWPTEQPVRVRIGIHTGEAELRGGDYYGPVVNRCARIRAAGHGGQTLISGATASHARNFLPARVALKDLGEHRLKDLQRPERIFQLIHPSLQSEFPPLRTLNAVPHNLPQQITSFVGREAEAGELRGLLLGSRLVTVTGLGGVGKTRLSVQVAADMVDQHEDGVWLVDLGSVGRSALVPEAIACTIGLPADGDPHEASDWIRLLVDQLRSKQMLIVLDGCEHVLAGCAHAAVELLNRCPQVRVLATSRERLGVPGETTFRLPVLSVPDPRHLPELAAMERYDAVRLFVDRATAADPSFAMTAQNAAAVAKICHQLDGIPMAIELVAARVRAMPVEQIALHLDDRFAADAGSRNQTIASLINWSHELMTPEERAVFRRLSVFAGGCTLEAAEKVCSGGGMEEREVADLLVALVDKSLVMYYPDERPEPRYRLPDTVMAYARERLVESGEAAEWAGRHRSYFLALAASAATRLIGPEQALWYGRLGKESENLRAALGWCLSGRSAVDAARKLAELSRSWIAGDGAPARTLLSRGIAKAKQLGERAGVGGVLHSIGEAATRHAALPPATPLERVMAASEKPPSEGAVAMFRTAAAACRDRDLTTARKLFQECLLAFANDGHLPAVALALDRLSAVAQQERELVKAASLVGAAEALLERTGIPCREAFEGYAARVGELSRALGHPIFTSAWSKGRALPLASAISMALGRPV